VTAWKKSASQEKNNTIKPAAFFAGGTSIAENVSCSNSSVQIIQLHQLALGLALHVFESGGGGFWSKG